MKQIKYIGMDLGSCYSFIVLSDGNSYYDFDIDAVDKIGGENCGCATRLYQKPNGEKVILSTKSAEKCAYKVIDRIKEDCINAQSTDASMKNMEAYLEQIFRKLADQTDKYDFSHLEKICVGFPKLEQYTEYSDKIKSLIQKVTDKLISEKKLAKESAGVEITANSEPYLSACAYISEELDRTEDKYAFNGQAILVVDAGGATLDVALVRAEPDLQNKIKLVDLSDYKASSDFTPGKLVNDVIMHHLVRMGLIDAERRNDFEYMCAVEDAKRALFSHKDYKNAKIEQELPNGKKFYLIYGHPRNAETVKLDSEKRLVFLRDNRGLEHSDKTFDCYMGGCASLVRNFIPQDIKINRVIFTGGCSKIEPLREHVLTKLEDLEHGKNLLCAGFTTTVLDKSIGRLHSANAVAYGACLCAAGKTAVTVESYMGANRRKAENRYFKGRDDFMKYSQALEYMGIDLKEALKYTVDAETGAISKDNESIVSPEEIEKLKKSVQNRKDHASRALLYALRGDWELSQKEFHEYKGHSYGSYLGRFIDPATGTVRFLDEAKISLLEEVSKNSYDALVILGQVYLFGRGRQRHIGDAIKLFEQAISAKFYDAYYWLARAKYEIGETDGIINSRLHDWAMTPEWGKQI